MIDKSLIKINQDLKTREEIFEVLADLVNENEYSNSKSEVVEALNKREMESTTGMTDGFAIPHAKSAAITKPGIAFLKLTNPIDWESMDGKPIQFVIALFIPKNEAGTTHLKYLSDVARLLMKKDFREAFKDSQTVEELEILLRDSLEK